MNKSGPADLYVIHAPGANHFISALSDFIEGTSTDAANAGVYLPAAGGRKRRKEIEDEEGGEDGEGDGGGGGNSPTNSPKNKGSGGGHSGNHHSGSQSDNDDPSVLFKKARRKSMANLITQLLEQDAGCQATNNSSTSAGAKKRRKIPLRPPNLILEARKKKVENFQKYLKIKKHTEWTRLKALGPGYLRVF
jgi:hypothetical protein